jgi:hypothetical protein
VKRRLIIGFALAALTAGSLAVPLAASGDRHERERLAIGIRVDFTDATHASGTFVACCAVNDSGTATADVTSFVPKQNGNEARFEATETLVGSQGTFTLALRGTTGPLTSPRHIARGRWSVTGGTGAYADLRGNGSFTAVTDTATGALTAVNRGHGEDDQ